MKIFISWSGDTSRRFAQRLQEWLRDVIQAVDPWVSSDDIAKGTQWQRELSRGLNDSEFGIVCVTEQSMDARWILFEAGALSRNFGNEAPSKVAVLLLDSIEPAMLQGPLAQFNATVAEREDMLRLVKTIDRSMGAERAIGEARVRRYFDDHWSKLQEAFADVASECSAEDIELGEPSAPRDIERHTFADPVVMFPFLLERCDDCTSAPSRSLDILGLTVGATWANLQFFLLREDVNSWHIRLTAFEGHTDEVKDHWAAETQKSISEISEFFSRPDVQGRGLTADITTYSFAPAVHGYLLSNGDLFLAVACREGSVISRKECPYEFIPGSDDSLYARTQRKVFETWFKAARGEDA